MNSADEYEYKPYYLEFWNCALYELLGWSEDRIHEWALQYDADLDSKNVTLFYHETPSYYISPLFITDKIRSQLEELEQDQKIAWPIASILDNEEPILEANWPQIRTKINEILNKYGESLDSISKLLPEEFIGKGIHPIIPQKQQDYNSKTN
ncbi:MAG: hypothetical protein JXM70_16875 [Pirellulales bacterium]|nr:hypothetical protein [Pirellulales bacterium]